MRKLATYEGVVENGHVTLPPDADIPEKTRVYGFRMATHKGLRVLPALVWSTLNKRKISKWKSSKTQAMPTYDSTQFEPPAPLARVTLRTLNNGNIVTDVPMLIDSGADLTLIPARFIEDLRLEVDQSESYELEGLTATEAWRSQCNSNWYFSDEASVDVSFWSTRNPAS